MAGSQVTLLTVKGFASKIFLLLNTNFTNIRDLLNTGKLLTLNELQRFHYRLVVLQVDNNAGLPKRTKAQLPCN